MRVISGKYRGLNLAQFQGKEIRPTSDRAKVSLFNILSFKIAGARVLDLFCGSGSLGIECLSRGASFVQFNDISPASIAVLNKNLARLRGENFAVSTADWRVCLAAAREPFDIIFIDPPYALPIGEQAVREIADARLLKADGTMVFERDRPFDGVVTGLSMYDVRRYGKAYLSFFTTDRAD